MVFEAGHARHANPALHLPIALPRLIICNPRTLKQVWRLGRHPLRNRRPFSVWQTVAYRAVVFINLCPLDQILLVRGYWRCRVWELIQIGVQPKSCKRPFERHFRRRDRHRSVPHGKIKVYRRRYPRDSQNDSQQDSFKHRFPPALLGYSHNEIPANCPGFACVVYPNQRLLA